MALTQQDLDALKTYGSLLLVAVAVVGWGTSIVLSRRKEAFDKAQKQRELESKFHLDRKQALQDILVMMRETGNHMVNMHYLNEEAKWHISQKAPDNANAFVQSQRDVRMTLYNSLPRISGRCQFYGLIPAQTNLGNLELFTYFEGIYHVAMYDLLNQTSTDESVLQSIRDNLIALELDIVELVVVEEQLAVDALNDKQKPLRFKVPKLEYMRKVGDRVRREIPDVKTLELPDSVTTHNRFDPVPVKEQATLFVNNDG